MTLIKHIAIHYLLNPFILSLPLAIAIIVFAPFHFNKYLVEITGKQKTERQKYFVDLNHDGNSEEIRLYSNSIEIIKSGKVLFFSNYDGELTPTKDYIEFEDLDMNGNEDVILLTYIDGNIFINCFDPFTNKVLIKNQKIFGYNMHKGMPDFQIEYCGAFDTDNDQTREIFMAIMSAIPSNPRTFLSFNPANNKIKYANLLKTSIFYPFAFDLNDDGIKEFFGSTFTESDTCQSSGKQKVKTSIIGLLNNMQNMFNPIDIQVPHSMILMAPFITKKSKYIVALHICRGIENIPNSLTFYDKNGKGEKRREFYTDTSWEEKLFIPSGEKLFLMDYNGVIDELDSNLNMKPFANLGEFLFDKQPFAFDLDSDGEKEYIFTGRERNKLIITRKDFSQPMTIELPFRLPFYPDISLLKSKEKNNRLYVKNSDYECFIDYKNNPYLLFEVPFYIAIYGMVLLFSLLIMHIQKYRSEQKYNAEKRIAELQLRSIKHRLDPHFTLNLLNSISALIFLEDKEKALQIFDKFAKIGRASDNITITLKEEIEFVKSYLELERFRFSDNFDFSIIVDNDVDMSFKIPKMQIQLFVENAIKNGIKHLRKRGAIEISASLKNNEYLINITDNGVGRQMAEKYDTFGMSKSIDIMNEMLFLYSKLKKTRIKYHIKDLYDEQNKPGGTLVSITIPKN